MPCENQSCCSTTGSRARPDRTALQATTLRTKVTSVVHSAIQRALSSVASLSPRRTQDQQRADQRQDQQAGEDPRAGHQRIPPNRYQVANARDADQHREGVVVDVAGLQPHDVARHVEHARGDAVGAEPVDDRAVAALPEQPADAERRPHEQEVVELVEVPLVEQEAVEQPDWRRPAPAARRGRRCTCNRRRRSRPSIISVGRNDTSARDMLHVLEDLVVRRRRTARASRSPRSRRR